MISKSDCEGYRRSHVQQVYPLPAVRGHVQQESSCIPSNKHIPPTYPQQMCTGIRPDMVRQKINASMLDVRALHSRKKTIDFVGANSKSNASRDLFKPGSEPFACVILQAIRENLFGKNYKRLSKGSKMTDTRVVRRSLPQGSRQRRTSRALRACLNAIRM